MPYEGRAKFIKFTPLGTRPAVPASNSPRTKILPNLARPIGLVENYEFIY